MARLNLDCTKLLHKLQENYKIIVSHLEMINLHLTKYDPTQLVPTSFKCSEGTKSVKMYDCVLHSYIFQQLTSHLFGLNPGFHRDHSRTMVFMDNTIIEEIPMQIHNTDLYNQLHTLDLDSTKANETIRRTISRAIQDKMLSNLHTLVLSKNLKKNGFFYQLSRLINS